ncbi:type II secretion system protein GspL [Sphingomonas sp. C3-2]|uniref:type II secretion system protein GspL n=1 Tax=Sphingomonas sp. C3-2 TaxID=3062169 RepID=UPI00294B0B36|nr:type II secretion system protein GspL [Sphingomonas sp. C3-2]WOK36825.1 type II secretion system protein GspL [Sphingomonas sp. C3-2]
MNDQDFLILTLGHDDRIGWQKISGAAASAQGDDVATLTHREGRVIAVVPAQDVTMNWAELPGLTQAQARGAARLLAAENSISPIETLHIAVGADEGADGTRAVATVARHLMDRWLGAVQAHGLDPEAIIPASVLVARPDQGFAVASIFGQDMIVGGSSAFADEPVLTQAILGGEIPQRLSEEDVARALPALIDRPLINLRQGDYARSTKWKPDRAAFRRIGVLIAAIIGISALVPVVQILRYNHAAAKVEADTAALARSLVPGAASDAGAIATLQDELTAARGGGAGFAPSTAAVFAAVRSVPNAELTAYDFGLDGTVRISVATQAADDQAAFVASLQKFGFSGQGSAPQQVAGRFVAEYSVRAK